MVKRPHMQRVTLTVFNYHSLVQCITDIALVSSVMNCRILTNNNNINISVYAAVKSSYTVP